MIAERLRPEDMERARELYLAAFPAYERAEWCDLVAHSDRDDAELLGLYDGGMVGISYLIFDEGHLFILYLAVDDAARGKGYGSEALRILSERHPSKGVFLNIEPVDDDAPNLEQRVRRLAFYNRNGFEATWRMVVDQGDEYTVMCRGEPMTPELLSSFRERHGFELLFGPGRSRQAM